MGTQDTIFDLDLITRYDRSGPRYTSYPTAVQFTEEVGVEQYRHHAIESNAAGNPLSLYFHIPFCDTVCFYCGFNKIATKDRSRSGPYLQRLFRELELQSELFARTRRVEQLHWGGGTPTFISHAEMEALMAKIRDCFDLCDDRGEYSIEIDPREVEAGTITLLRELGFNRISIGIQDFDPQVQRAVNRIQSEEQTIRALEAARSEGFKSVSVDLIYGLPLQSVEGFAATLERTIDIEPDRISVFNYAHLPELFKPQRRIEEAELPEPWVKLEILRMTIARLTAAGYLYIGMDHFAKPDDELAVAQRDGSLHRNFQGYSTHADCDLLGLGVTSVAMVGDLYAQNLKGLDDYYASIDASRLAIFRGVELTADDRLRREVITRLICHFELPKSLVESNHGIVFDRYFEMELRELQGMADDGLLRLEEDRITVNPVGKLLIRNICMVFDRYLREQQNQRFSKLI